MYYTGDPSTGIAVHGYELKIRMDNLTIVFPENTFPSGVVLSIVKKPLSSIKASLDTLPPGIEFFNDIFYEILFENFDQDPSYIETFFLESITLPRTRRCAKLFPHIFL